MAHLPCLVRHVRIGLMPTSSHHCVQVTSRSVLCPWQHMLITCPGFISSVSSSHQPVQSPQSVPLDSVCAWTRAHEKASLPGPRGRRSAGPRYVNASDGPGTRFWTLSNLIVGGTQGLTLLPPKYREPPTSKNCTYLGKVALFLEVCFHLHVISWAPHCAEIPLGEEQAVCSGRAHVAAAGTFLSCFLSDFSALAWPRQVACLFLNLAGCCGAGCFLVYLVFLMKRVLGRL